MPHSVNVYVWNRFFGMARKKNQREHPRVSNCTHLFHKMLPSSRALAVECLCALVVCLHTTVCSIRFASNSIDMGESKKKSNSSSPIMIFYYTYSVYRTGRWAVIIRRAIVSPVVVGTRTSFNPNGLLLLLAAGQVVLLPYRCMYLADNHKHRLMPPKMRQTWSR